MSDCNSQPCVIAQCPEACGEVIFQSCENTSIVGVGTYGFEAENIYNFRGIRGVGDIVATLNPGLKTVDLSIALTDHLPQRTFTNAADRMADVPSAIGQLGVQEDTLIQYTAVGLNAGDWSPTLTNGQPLNLNLTGISGVGNVGLLFRTSNTTSTGRTITGSSSVLVANGNGGSADPAISVIPSGLDINAMVGGGLSIPNGGTGTTTGFLKYFGSAFLTITADLPVFSGAGEPFTPQTLFCDASGGSFTLTLPPDAITAYAWRFKRIDSAGGNTVTIVVQGGGTIDGAASYVLAPLDGVGIAQNNYNGITPAEWDILFAT